MLTLTQENLEKQAQTFLAALDHGQYDLDGVTVPNVPIYRKERTGTTVRIYLMVDYTITGRIDNVKLFDQSGDVVAILPEAYDKPADRGLYITAKYQFTEQEGVGVVSNG